MRRHFFVGIGIFTIILGLQCFAVEEFVMTTADERLTGPLSGYHYMQSEHYEGEVPEHLRRRWKVTEAAPWSITAAGIVLVIYAKTLYQGGGKEKH